MREMSFDPDIVIEKILNRVKKTANRLNGNRPGDIDENYRYQAASGGYWTDSFWVGMLYLAFAETNDEFYLRHAAKQQAFYRLRIQNTEVLCEQNNWMALDHDVGFVFSLSQVARYKLIADAEAKSIARKAADFLAGRFNEQGSFIRAWDTWKWDTDEKFIFEKKGKVIIDSMMNIPLLFWAYEEGGNSRYREIALKHAETVLRHMVRKDGSTFHTFNFNPDTGAPIGGKTGQGYADDSCWSRGQSWAIYGFALLYSYTNDTKWLEIAVSLADYFLNHLTDIFVPVWDFATLDNKEIRFRPWDSSAACIAASGILEICKHLPQGSQRENYMLSAQKILHHVTLLCSTLDLEDADPLLLHGCGGPAYKRGAENTIRQNVDIPLVFGDYFYLESLLKLKNLDFQLFW